jgi:uncharacterized protein (UPF0248 family)
MSKRKPSLVVTGTGRCGTQWLTWCLKELGATAVHECYYRPYGSGNREPVPQIPYIEVSWMAALDIKSIKCPIIHLVRHPYKVAASISRIIEKPHRTRSQKRRNALRKFSYSDDCTENAVARLLRMNRLIERHAVARVRAEDGWEAVETVLTHAGIQIPRHRIRRIVSGIPTNVNAGDVRPVKWPSHPVMHRLEEMTRRYGYEV